MLHAHSKTAAQRGGRPFDRRPDLETERLSFRRFCDGDVVGLAALLSDPEVARTITANTATPEKAAACARQRIAWHNGAWETKGFGAWALFDRDRPREGAAPRLIGWCGFAAPDVGSDPEILYGLARDRWGCGLAREAATGAIDWLLANSAAAGVSALIMARLNPGSLKVAQRLGFTRRGTMNFADFMQDRDLAQEVLEFEVWRLAEGASPDPETLLFQAPYKAGQIAAIGIADEPAILAALLSAARRRPDFAGTAPEALDARVGDAFRQGIQESLMDWYHLPRAAWRSP